MKIQQKEFETEGISYTGRNGGEVVMWLQERGMHAAEAGGMLALDHPDGVQYVGHHHWIIKGALGEWLTMRDATFHGMFQVVVC